MIIIYYTIGCIILFAIILAIIQSNDEKMHNSILHEIEKRKDEYTDFFSILRVDYNNFKSFTYKKAIIIVGLIYLVNIVKLFETKKYEITPDGNLYRSVETYWGFKKKEYLLDSRDGKWYVLIGKDGSFNGPWIELDDDDEDFYDIENEREYKEWFE